MIIVKLKGGMGNQMFQYAIGRALSIKYDVPLGLDLDMLLDRTPRPKFHRFTFYDYNLDIFNINPQILPQNKIPFLYRKIFKGKIGLYFNYFKKYFIKNNGEEKYFHFNPYIFSVGPDVYLDGYWQSPKYFESIEDIIRKDFTLKNELSENIKTLKKEIEENKSLCIHVRRGDYIGNPVHDILDKEYYNKGIEKIKEITQIDKVYVFSNDIKWCKENLSFPYSTMFVDEEYRGAKDEGNLFLMSACHNFIIPNSSFSWWAAWLSSYKDKIVIVPKQWFGDKNINSEDLIPKEWIRI